MKTSSRTSMTLMTNQITRAAIKSATNVALDNLLLADGSEPFSSSAPRRRPRAARRPAPPSRVPWPVPGASGQQPHLAFERQQLLVRVGFHLESLELLHQGITREILVHLGGGDQLALLVLDLLRHPLERFEGALVRNRPKGLLNAFVRLGPLLARDQDVLLTLRFFDLVVQLPQRALELFSLLAVLDPCVVQLHGVLN